MKLASVVVITVVVILFIAVLLSIRKRRRHRSDQSSDWDYDDSRLTLDNERWDSEDLTCSSEDSYEVHAENDSRFKFLPGDRVYDASFFKLDSFKVESEHVEQQVRSSSVPEQETKVKTRSEKSKPESEKVGKSYPKPATVPTFVKNHNDASQKLQVSDHDYMRFRTEASNSSKVSLPKNFSAIKEWAGMITGVYDQERCGSCWAFAVCSSVTDRFRIKSAGKALKDGDYLSPFHLAACMKCGKNNACPKVCEGNYLDDVLQYVVDNGAVAQSAINNHSDQGEEYRCFDWEAAGVKPFKGLKKYRVNLYPPSMLDNKKNLAENEKAIMEEIYKGGSVCCIIKVYVPMDKRNFYLYQTGIYGAGWESEPKETDGYHAINILGWGEDATPEGIVKYWIVRNSWSTEWGTMGLARILRGENFGMIESDVWALDPDLSGHDF